MAGFNFNDPALKHREVRLFPTVDIKGEKEAEMRATAALLAMVRAVPDFGKEIISQAGGPGGKAKNVQCFTEVKFLPDFPEDNEPARPDGIICRAYGKNIWCALVEVKVNSNSIDDKQVNTYLKWANSLDFDALITVSNQVNQPNGEPPYDYNRKVKRVKVKHFSWEEIHSISQLFCGKDESIEDVDQRWMLEQFNHYLADEKSRIIAPPTLGKSWHAVLSHVRANTLSVHLDLVQDTVEQWLAFLRIASFKLGAKIGGKVRVCIPAKYKNDPSGFIKAVCKETIDKGVLTGELDFPGMDAIRLCLDLKTKKLQLSHKIEAPEEGRRDTRVNWMIRELKKMEKIPSDIRVKVDWRKRGLVTSASYGELGDGIIPLLRGKEDMQVGKDVMPRLFFLERETPLCGARGKGSVQELKGILDDLEDFYGFVQPINRPPKKTYPISKEDEPTAAPIEAKQTPVAAPERNLIISDFKDTHDIPFHLPPRESSANGDFLDGEAGFTQNKDKP
jgi:hypothetical protein